MGGVAATLTSCAAVGRWFLCLRRANVIVATDSNAKNRALEHVDGTRRHEHDQEQ